MKIDQALLFRKRSFLERDAQFLEELWMSEQSIEHALQKTKAEGLQGNLHEKLRALLP